MGGSEENNARKQSMCYDGLGCNMSVGDKGDIFDVSVGRTRRFGRESWLYTVGGTVVTFVWWVIRQWHQQYLRRTWVINGRRGQQQRGGRL